MNKTISLDTAGGWFQYSAYLLMTGTFFMNVLAVYVGVVQPYHVYRLSSAGPTGFEMASTYYMNPNMIFWRRAAIKSMFTGLPIFLVASGLRLMVKFTRDQPDADGDPQSVSALFQPRLLGVTLLGFISFVLYSLFAALLVMVHLRHDKIYKQRFRENKAVSYLPFLMSTVPPDDFELS